MSKITRRSYKRKKIIMGASLFGAIGLVSTGFAAWVLSAPTSAEAGPASLHVGDVTDKNMEFKNIATYLDDGVTPSSDYYFEPAAGDKSGRVRLGGEQSESLELDVKGELWRVQNLGSITGRITLSNEDKAKLDSAIDKGYIVAPTAYQDSELPLWTKGTSAITKDENFTETTAKDDDSGDDVMTFTYKVFFEWGDAFNGLNPSVYFDEDDDGKAVETGTPEDALSTGTVGAILTDMHNLLDNVSLKLTLTANPD